jgi:hypothetical protein
VTRDAILTQVLDLLQRQQTLETALTGLLALVARQLLPPSSCRLPYSGRPRLRPPSIHDDLLGDAMPRVAQSLQHEGVYLNV